jgi:hypothetical protein
LVRIAIREGSMQSNLRSDPKVKALAHSMMTNNWQRLGLINGIQNKLILANRVLSIASEYSKSNSITNVLFFLFKPFNDKYPKFSFNLFLFLALLSRISLKRASNDK